MLYAMNVRGHRLLGRAERRRRSAAADDVTLLISLYHVCH